MDNATEAGLYSGWSTFSNTAFGSWTGILTLLVLKRVSGYFSQVHFAASSNQMFLCIRDMNPDGLGDWFKIEIPKVTA